MPSVVVDTHTIVWHLSRDARLSARAAGTLNAANSAGDPIHVPSICLVEVIYLVEKGRLPAAARERLFRALDDPRAGFLIAPLDRLIVEAMQSVNRDEVPDLPDRVVAATAVALRVPVVSRDRKIRASNVESIW